MFESAVNKSIEPIRWLLVLAIAYTLSSTIWTFFQTPASSSATPATTTNAQSDVRRDPGNLNWIVGKHLFGEAGAAPVVTETQSTETAAPTRLPLLLQSVMVASEPEDSTAIIAQKGKSGLIYRIGENVPGNAELVEILGDRVILRRAGVREALLFPKPKLTLITDVPDSSGADGSVEADAAAEPATAGNFNDDAASAADQAVADTLDDYRQRLEQDADGTLNDLGIETVESGGYRVGDVAQSPYLRNTGLQPGDIVLSVNGRQVGDIEQDRLELDNILAQGSARIEVQRGDRRFFITASLP